MANASSFPSAAGVKIAKQQTSSDDSDETNAVTVPVSTLFTALKKTLIQRKPKEKPFIFCTYFQWFAPPPYTLAVQ